ncbi:MAG: hypothetical protein ACI92G_003338 [Candidatus Pelagisphaera sp.]|jgi:hypothetical protein
MKTSKIIIASIAATIAANVSFAESSANKTFKKHQNPEQLVAQMFANHDNNSDGVLDSAELANSIAGLYDQRQTSMIERRETLVEKGVISEYERSKGVITLRLHPDDGAAILMKDGDANQDNALSANELTASVSSLRKLDLGTRGNFDRRS